MTEANVSIWAWLGTAVRAYAHPIVDAAQNDRLGALAKEAVGIEDSAATAALRSFADAAAGFSFDNPDTISDPVSLGSSLATLFDSFDALSGNASTAPKLFE